MEDDARKLLAACAELEGDEGLVEVALAVLAFTSHLLDDDDNLTRVGNLSGAARGRLAERTLELLDATPTAPEVPE
ncbi:MAG: hypothetical protein R3B07_05955 [Polyangiaceae bacterium]